MNCAVCSGYLALKHEVKKKRIRMTYCEGCRPRGEECAFLKRRCELLLGKKVDFCYGCNDFPCERLQRIGMRYQAHFHMSIIDNLEYVRDNGMEEFLRSQQKKWRCPECGGVACCRNGICFNCGLEKLKRKKKLYRWEDWQIRSFA